MSEGGAKTGLYVDVRNINNAHTLKQVSGSASSAGNNTLVAAVTGKVIKVFRYLLQAEGTVDAKLIDGSGGTQLSPDYSFQAREGATEGVTPPYYLFKTAASTALLLYLGGAVAVNYTVRYWDDDDS